MRMLRVNAVAAMALTALILSAAPDAPVADAAMRGDVEAVRTLIKSGADVNAAQGDGMTALHWAAMDGHADRCSSRYPARPPSISARRCPYRFRSARPCFTAIG